MIMRRAMSSLRVGLLGLGFMGRGIAANLVKGLPQLTVFDISSENTQLFKNCLGPEEFSKVTFADSVNALAERSDIVCLSLPSEAVCSEVLFGSTGITQTWNSMSICEKLILDHCTSSKDFSLQLSDKLRTASASFHYMDCPVSGGPTGAKNATLSIMVGGSREDFTIARPILQLIGKNILHFGSVGSGMAAKLVNNALVTAHAQCAVEALLMAERLGLFKSNDNSTNRIQTLFDMLNTSWGQSKVLELIGNDYISFVANHGLDSAALKDFPTQAPLRNLKKDMNCVIHDIKNTFSDTSDAEVRRSFPVFYTTYDCLDRACSVSHHGLGNSPFAALLIPIQEEASKLTK